VARDRKRAKQRRARQRPAAAGRGAPEQGHAADAEADPSAAPRSDVAAPPGQSAASPANGDGAGRVERADLPGALEHAGDVDEFDAALIAGAGGVAADPETLSEVEIEAEAEAEGDLSEDELQEAVGADGDGTAVVGPGQASGAPIRKGNRAIGFLRASWAELQRVQWPDRRHVFQATAVVLGFVAIAGAYLGLADYVAKEIVEFIL
jgi:preprotein translocase subunit SecE